MKRSYAQYEQKKAALVASIQKGTHGGQNNGTLNSKPISLYKKRSNLFRAGPQETQKTTIDVTSFNQVLDIDPDTMLADIEAMTPYETIVQATLAQGLLPTVVPELKSITIGGAAAGLGIESSSFKYGLVHESIVEMELLLSDGQVLICRPDNEHKDLFYAFPNTYGTISYALRVKVQLIKAAKYVKLAHHRYISQSSYFDALNTLCYANQPPNSPIAYIDGTIFSKTEMVITTGEFVDTAPYVSNYKYMQIYYRSIQSRTEDFLSTEDYIWRWDADWFWCSDTFGMQNRILRFLFGKWMLSSIVYNSIMHFFHRHPSLGSLFGGNTRNQESVIQDVLIPLGTSSDFLDFLQENIQIYPIWICPIRSPSNSYGRGFDFCPLNRDKLYLDFGFWGTAATNKEPGYYNREIEQKAVSLNGLKSLYSSSFYTPKEFWNIYDESRYKTLKSQYDPHGRLSTLYDVATKK
jgi:FAD/FMN-containing dehydrogenase